MTTDTIYYPTWIDDTESHFDRAKERERKRRERADFEREYCEWLDECERTHEVARLRLAEVGAE